MFEVTNVALGAAIAGCQIRMRAEAAAAASARNAAIANERSAAASAATASPKPEVTLAEGVNGREKTKEEVIGTVVANLPIGKAARVATATITVMAAGRKALLEAHFRRVSRKDVQVFAAALNHRLVSEPSGDFGRIATAMPTANQRLTILNNQIEHARLAIDERRSLVRIMEQEGENTEDARRLLAPLQRSLEEMIEFREQVRRELEGTGQ